MFRLRDLSGSYSYISQTQTTNIFQGNRWKVLRIYECGVNGLLNNYYVHKTLDKNCECGFQCEPWLNGRVLGVNILAL